MKNTTTNTILLVFLYDLDRLPDLDYLCSIVTDFDIYITCGLHLKNNNQLNYFLSKYSTRVVKIKYHDNYGVDILPFIKQICDIDPKKYPYFIKLHSKKSKLGLYKHVDWGTILWDSLIGNTSIFAHNLKIISQSHIGVITHPFLIYNKLELNNGSKIQILCDTLEIDYSKVKDSRFMAGSMFMGKTVFFQNSLSRRASYINTLLSTETGKVDDTNYLNGTFSHAMERILGYIITHNNLHIHPSSLFPVIKIYNKQHKILHLHITYNNQCYLVEDFNIYGSIIYQNAQSMTIKWNHLNNKDVTYKYLNPKHITKSS